MKDIDASNEFRRRAAAIVASAEETFAGLLRDANLDPLRSLRFCDWSGSSFAGMDLRGMDFTAARLVGCDFRNSAISTARFDQAVLGEVNKPKSTHVDLSIASDWSAHCQTWTPAHRAEPDGHLLPGEIFQDAPFAPRLVVLEPVLAGAKSSHGAGRGPLSYPLAVAQLPLTDFEVALFRGRAEGRQSTLDARSSPRRIEQLGWSEMSEYLDWLSDSTGQEYRLLSEAEWEYAMKLGYVDNVETGQRNLEWCEDFWRELPPDDLTDGHPWTDGSATERVKRIVGESGPHRKLRHPGSTLEGRAAVRVARELIG